MKQAGLHISKNGIDNDCSYEKHTDIVNLPKYDGWTEGQNKWIIFYFYLSIICKPPNRFVSKVLR